MRSILASRVLERAQEVIDQRRLIIGLCLAVAVALVAAIPGILTSAGGGQSVRTQGFVPVPRSTTTLVEAVGVVNPVIGPPPNRPPPTTSTTRPALVLGRSITRPTTTVAAKPAPKPNAPASTAPPKGPGPTTPPCRNSYDAACGPFRWDPDPGPNQAITGGVAPDTQTVKMGDKVTFTVTGTDPDAAPLQECNIDFGDGMGVHCDPRPAIDPSYCPKQYGPWTPPAKKEGNLNTVWDHKYDKPGTYKVTFQVRSAMQECNNPYASTADLQATVFVTP